VWISTSSTLTRVRNGRYTTIGPENGLPGKIIASLVDDEQGYVWVGVNSGGDIVRFSRSEADAVESDPAHQIDYSLFGVSDGLQGEVHWQSRPGAVRARDGRLWFVTGLGVAVIDPRRPMQTRVPSPLRLEQVTVNGRPIVLDGPQTQLPHRAAIRIDYAVPDLSAGSKFRFRHLLEGAETVWQDAGTRREATYASLSPGSYRFRVSATGVADSAHAEAAWSFVVGPPLYQTPWFYAASVFGAALVVWGAWQLRLRTVRNQFALVVAERTRVSREIHDTLLQSLGAVALELEVVARELDTAPHASGDALRKLRAKVRNCVREARQSVWELRSPVLERHSLAEALREFGEETTAAGTVEVQVTLAGRLPRFGTDIAHHLLRIAQEATNNAIRHGGSRRVHIELAGDRDMLRLRISDDGCGFTAGTPSADPVRDRWGIVNMHERAERIGGTLTVSSAPGRGTVVEAAVRLPS
jgi:signal transduction histidine kinase